MRLRGVIVAALAAGLASCAKPPPDIPVGPLGVPFDVDADQINSFICANEKHFTIAYLPTGIVFSTGVGGVLSLRITGSTSGVRYIGGNFTVVTMANRATVYYDDQPVMYDCLAIMQ